MSHSKLCKYEENNWACVVVCLKKTAAVLHTTVEERFRKQIDSWDNVTKKQFKTFTEGVSDNSVRVTYVPFAKRQGRQSTNAWKISIGDSHYENILEKVLAIHSNPRSKKIQWDSNRNAKSESFWILAKIFMPYGNTYHCQLTEADPISYFDLLRNCTLFNDFDVTVVDQLCSARNEVMHSIDQRLTAEQKDHYISMMDKLLDTPCLKGKQEVWDMKYKTLNRMKHKKIFFEPVDIVQLELEFRKMFPNKSFNRDELLEDTSKLYDNYVSSGVKNLKKELETETKNLKKHETEVEKYKTIGGVTGAAAAGTVVAGYFGGAPVIIAGGIAAGLGYLGGRAGGAVIGLFRRII